MAAHHQQQQALRRPLSIAIALCLLSLSDSQGTRPSAHGLVHEKNPAEEVSPAMIEFFGAQPKAELPEARNVSDPSWRSAAKVTPAEPDHTHSIGVHKGPASLLIGGVVFAALGIGLLATGVVAYMLHARRAMASSSSSSSLVGLTHWRGGPEVLGAP